MTYGGRVFIGGISSNVSKDDINNEFGKYGKLRNVWIASRPPGFAFVEYDNNRDAEEAVKSLNGVSLFNENKIRVEISKKRPGPKSEMSNRRSDNFRGGPDRGSNPNFRTGNSTSFKSKSRFLGSSSGSRSGSGPRISQGQRFSRGGGRLGGSTPRFNNSNSNQTQRFSSQKPRFPSSRPGAPRFGQNSGGQFNSGGGFKSGNLRSNRPMDN